MASVFSDSSLIEKKFEYCCIRSWTCCKNVYINCRGNPIFRFENVIKWAASPSVHQHSYSHLMTNGLIESAEQKKTPYLAVNTKSRTRRWMEKMENQHITESCFSTLSLSPSCGAVPLFSLAICRCFNDLLPFATRKYLIHTIYHIQCIDTQQNGVEVSVEYSPKRSNLKNKRKAIENSM